MHITLRHRLIERADFAKLTVSQYLFLLFWVMKPFYLGPSGTLQIADLVLVLSFAAWVISLRGSIVMERIDLSLIGFVGCTFVINGIYYVLLGDRGLLMSSAYYLYNALVVIVFRSHMQSKGFLKALLWASAFNLLTQLAVLFLGAGSYLWGIERFMGTFNDPNQFAFSMFTSFLLVYVLSSYRKEVEPNRSKLLVLFLFGLLAYFIVKGSSTGMLLGVGAFALGFALLFLHSEKTAAFVLLRTLAIMLLVAFLVFMLFFGVSISGIDSSVSSDTFLVFRLFEKIGKVESGGFMALIEDRAIDKIFRYPLYVFFGAGEGAFARFTGPLYEIHSTLPGILFYYGILPFLLLIRWMRHNLRNVSWMVLPAFLALFLESFTLANQRQPAFWMLIMLGSLVYADKRELRKYRMVVPL